MSKDSTPTNSGSVSYEAFVDQNVLQSAREKLKSMDIETVDGVPHLRMGRKNDCKTVIDLVKDSEIFPDDVFNVGFPRSGNRWSFEVVSMVMSQRLEFNETEFSSRLIEFVDDVNGTMESIPRPRLLVSHLPLDQLPRDVLKQKPKVVYILRNPKDTFASWYRLWHGSKVEADGQDNLTWSEFFELMITGELPWGSWFELLLRSEKFMTDHPDVPVFVLQFEQMKENPAKVIRELCKFLGQPEDKAEEIARNTEMESMRKGIQKKVEDLESTHFKEKGVLHKKGVVGEWKKQFTVSQNERFNSYFKQKMAGSQLAKQLEPYMQ